MMACGLPIVVTDVGGVRDYVQGSGVSMLPPGDSEGFARAVDAFLHDPAARGVSAALSRAHAVLEFSLPACAKKLAAIYSKVLG